MRPDVGSGVHFGRRAILRVKVLDFESVDRPMTQSALYPAAADGGADFNFFAAFV